MKKEIKNLMNNLCCSKCKAEFDSNSFITIKKEKDIQTIKLICNNCGKDFGIGFLKITKSKNKNSLIVTEGLEAINFDDVIDAHKFIKNLDRNWKEYLPKSK